MALRAWWWAACVPTSGKERVRGTAEALAAGRVCAAGGLHGALVRCNVRYHSYVPTLKKAGVPYIQPHDLRHTAATPALLDGQPVKAASEMLGASLDDDHAGSVR